MKLIIDIPEAEYQNYLKMRPAYPEGVFCHIKAIQNGTPLPKGHGRLIDANWVQKYQIDTFGQRLLVIDTAPTIIEADKEE